MVFPLAMLRRIVFPWGVIYFLVLDHFSKRKNSKKHFNLSENGFADMRGGYHFQRPAGRAGQPPEALASRAGQPPEAPAGRAGQPPEARPEASRQGRPASRKR